MAQGPMFIGSNGYTLPPATKNALGGVIVGENLTVSEVGEIDVPVATKNTPGVIKVGDGLELDEEGRLNSNGALGAYPVGSIYQSTDPTSPAALFGGTWEKIASDRVLMGASSTHAAGTTVEAGLPNITGGFGGVSNYDGHGAAVTFGSFKMGDTSTNETRSGTGVPFYPITFSASSSSSIYGSSKTVQPPAYFVWIWRRIS